MPLYEYGCKKCLERFEKIFPVDSRGNPEKEACPSCGEENCVEIVISAPGLVFGFRGSTVQSKAPEGFKDILREIKKNTGGKATGIEL